MGYRMAVMSKRRMSFNEWCSRVRRCAEIFRRGGTSREARRVADGIMRHSYALVCAVLHNPFLDLTPDDYETYYAAQLRVTQKKNLGPTQFKTWTNDRLARCKKKPRDVSDARWRMHLEWRHHRERYASLPPESF